MLLFNTESVLDIITLVSSLNFISVGGKSRVLDAMYTESVSRIYVSTTTTLFNSLSFIFSSFFSLFTSYNTLSLVVCNWSTVNCKTRFLSDVLLVSDS